MIAILAAICLVALGAILATASNALPSDWYGLLGAILGSGLTVIGSIFVLQWQNGFERREEIQLILELIGDVEAECIPFQVADEAALKKRYGRDTVEQIDRLSKAIDRLKRSKNHLGKLSAKHMRAYDAFEPASFEGAEINLWIASGTDRGADFGQLNAMAHEVSSFAASARRELT